MGRVDFLGRLPGLTFVVTPDVLAEIVQPDQKQQTDGAVAAGILRIEELSGPEALALFAELRHLMGAGDRREALARLGPGRILTTPGLYVVAIRSGLVSVKEADADKATLEACKFKMDFSSFRDLVSAGSRKPRQK